MQLDDLRTRTAGDVSAAKERLGRSAARAYRQSGGVELNAALEAVRGAEDLLDLSRDVHLISTYSEYETDNVERLERQQRATERDIERVSRRRSEAKEKLDDANGDVRNLTTELSAAYESLTLAEVALQRFKELATTSASPIMGPNRLTAPQLADFIRNNGYAPNLTVTIDELAQFYIEESEKLGIRGDVAFAQSILETGGFNFSGSMVEIPDNNYAGIGACDSCTRGFIFPEARLGVRAQMQLLRVYVDKGVKVDSLPDPLLLPGTLRLGFRGRVQSWWDLTGTWATASDYGIRVYEIYLRMVAEADAATAFFTPAGLAPPG